MNTVARAPASRAAQATAWPWFPALAVTTPAVRSASESEPTLFTAPRILKEPVRCRFSALRTTGRRDMRVSVSDEYTGVTRATPSSRSRAAWMSASVGAVRTAIALLHLEHLLHDLSHRGQRVELAPLDLAEQPTKLRVLR